MGQLVEKGCIVIHEWFVRFFLYYFNDIPESIVTPLHPTTVRLQGKTNDIIQAFQDINNVIYNLKYMRGNVEIEFKNIFQKQSK